MESKLAEYRAYYNEIFDVRHREIDVPEEMKTLKTMTFVAIERELLHMCAEEKFRLGIVTEKPGRAYGMTYGKRKRGSWMGVKS